MFSRATDSLKKVANATPVIRSIPAAAGWLRTRLFSSEAGDAAPLPGKRDHYNGIIVDPDALPSSAAEFSARLKDSLRIWNDEKVNGIWLRLPTALSAFVPVAVDQGFGYHHAEPDYVMLTKWLPTHRPSALPANASHQIGVGGLVIRNDGKVLAIKERHGPGKFVGWKIPGGLVDAGEDLGPACEREVFEETGVHAKFRSILTFRHRHKAFFEKSDLYFVCRLDLADSENELKLCSTEVSAVEWVAIDDIMSQKHWTRHPEDNVLSELGRVIRKNIADDYGGITGHFLRSPFRREEVREMLYHGDEASREE